jgi:predicted RND superfamily exporter protein
MSRDCAILLATASQWIALALCVALGIALFGWVDLTPKAQPDFFFSNDDPQLQASLDIEKEFGQSEQIFVAVRSDNLRSTEYLRRLRKLTNDLSAVEGVVSAESLTHGPKEPDEIVEQEPDKVFEEVSKRPFWGSEHLRRQLREDLRLFSIGAFVAFGLLVPSVPFVGDSDWNHGRFAGGIVWDLPDPPSTRDAH